MEWINLRITKLRSAEYMGSRPVERATWVNVLCYCCEQENGGRILGAAAWKDRQWQQCCGVTGREVRGASKLLFLEGKDVVIFGYPADKEHEVKARRIQAGDAARRRWDAQLGDAPCNASRSHPDHASRIVAGDASRIAPRNAEGEGELERECIVGVSGVFVPEERPLPGPHTHAKSSDFFSLESMRARWPMVALEAELVAAERYLRKSRGAATEQAVDLAWFEREWLPKVGPKRGGGGGTSGDSGGPAEPAGWQAWIDAERPESVYAEGRASAGTPWEKIDAFTQHWIIQQMNLPGAARGDSQTQ